jgi:hypothetical protein
MPKPSVKAGKHRHVDVQGKGVLIREAFSFNAPAYDVATYYLLCVLMHVVIPH